ncbi:unnamed protein product, partial [marine sediment metagenome]
MQEWFKYLQLNDPLQQKFRTQLEGILGVTKEVETSARELAGVYESELTFALRGVAEAARQLALSFAIEEAMNKFKEFGIVVPEIFNLVYAAIGASTETALEKVELTASDMAAQVGATLTALAGQSQELAIFGAIISTYAGAAKAIEYYAPPLSFIMAGLQIIAG